MKAFLKIFLAATVLMMTFTSASAKKPKTTKYSSQDLIGEWKNSGTAAIDGADYEFSTGFVFDSLGHYLRSSNYRFETEAEGKSIDYGFEMSVKGSYKVAGKTLLLIPNPLSFTATTDDDSSVPTLLKVIIKGIQEAVRVELIGNLNFPKILSLTESEFSIQEKTEDEDGDPGEVVVTVYSRMYQL